MKTAYTPGPWNIEHPYGEPGTYVSEPNTGLIAKLYPVDPGLFNVDKPVTVESNARLIATAPELLTSLVCLLKMVRDGDLTSDVLEEADAAIAKATGEQP